jgi:LysR family transcriptional regulator, low CO2-responsive transcriptional regulator
MLAPLLIAFYETVRQGSVTAAAKRLEVSQPTITTRIRQLEKQYGVELFHRRGSRFDLTDAGIVLMPMIDRMLQAESDIDFTLRNNGELRGGNLRVGATGPYYILPAIAAFHRQYPAVELCVEVANSQQVLDALIDSRIDLAVSSRLVDDARLVRITIATDALVVISHRDHPLARQPKVLPAQLAAHTLLLRERGSRTREIIEDTLQRHGVRPATLIEIGSREAIYEAICHNMGFTLMPIGEAPAHPDLRKSEFEGDAPTIKEYLYHLDSRSDARLIKAFLAYIEEKTDPTQNG